MIRAFAVVALAGLAGCASVPPEAPTCPTEHQAADFVRQYVARQQIALPPESMTMEGALCGRDKVARLLAEPYGRVVGYKAGLTNPAVQKRFNYGQPIRGTLFERMLVRDGAEVPANFGARPVFEADLVVEVKDTGIADAKTPLEVLQPVGDLPVHRAARPHLHRSGEDHRPGARLRQRCGTAGRAGRGNPGGSDAGAGRLAARHDGAARRRQRQGTRLGQGQRDARPPAELGDLARRRPAQVRCGGEARRPAVARLVHQADPADARAHRRFRAVYDGLPGTPVVAVRFR